jgi:hypothetical protein
MREKHVTLTAAELVTAIVTVPLPVAHVVLVDALHSGQTLERILRTHLGWMGGEAKAVINDIEPTRWVLRGL